MGYGRAVVQGDWKYIAVRYPPDREEELMSKYGGKPPLASPWPLSGDNLFPNYYDRDQLYNLKSDPYEQRNLFSDPAHAEKAEEMQGLMRGMLAPLPHVFGEFKETPGEA
jgi:arylsulfatase A